MDESNRVEEEDEGTPIEEPIVTFFLFSFQVHCTTLHCTSRKPNASNYVHYQQTTIEKGERERERVRALSQTSGQERPPPPLLFICFISLIQIPFFYILFDDINT